METIEYDGVDIEMMSAEDLRLVLRQILPEVGRAQEQASRDVDAYTSVYTKANEAAQRHLQLAQDSQARNDVLKKLKTKE